MPLKYKLINYHRLDVGNIYADNNETGANYLIRLRYMYNERQIPTPVINAPLPLVINAPPRSASPVPLRKSVGLRNRQY